MSLSSVPSINHQSCMDRKQIIRFFQAQTALQCFTERKEKSLSGATASLLIPAIETINETFKEAGFHDLRLQDGKDGTITLGGEIKRMTEFDAFVNSISPIDSEPFLVSLLTRLKNSLMELIPALRTTEFLSVRTELTGADGYFGDFMLEYECSPMAAGTQILWPDVRMFSEKHTNRFTLGNGTFLLQHAVGSILAYLPHEIVHSVQAAMKHSIDMNSDNGWLAEHDPSACSMNILKHALETDVDDEMCVEGLFEVVVLWLSLTIKRMGAFGNLDERSDISYCLWRDSCGYKNPELDDASVVSDYAKARLAVESCPYDVYRQISLLLNRTGDIRSQGISSAYTVPDPIYSYARVLVEMGMNRDSVLFSESALPPTVFSCMDIVLIQREDQPVFHHIIDNLYLGDIAAASKEWEFMKGISVVVDVSNSGYSELPGKDYIHLDIEDNRQTDIAVHFDRVSDLILRAREEKKNVLVHCQQGVSRSVTLVLAYLVKHGSGDGLSLRDAVSYLKSKRAQSGRAVHPNIGFFRQLLKYEEQVLGRSSLSASDHRSIFS